MSEENESDDAFFTDPNEVEGKMEALKTKLEGKELKSTEETPSEPSDKQTSFEELANVDDDFDRAMEQAEESKEEEPEKEERVEEKPEEKKEEVEVKEEKKELTEEQKTAEKVKEEVLKIVGEDAVAKIKGKEIKVKDFTSEETMFYLQKGFRGDELMREASEIKKQAESQLSQKADLANQILRERSEQPSGQSPRVTVPEELKEDELDDPQTKGLKALGRTLIEKVGNLEKQSQMQTFRQAEDSLLREVDSHVEDYPLARKEEVIAVKAFNPQIPTGEIMATSDKDVGSIEHVKNVFKHRPDIERQIFSEHVNKYLATKKRTSKAIPQKPTGSSKVRTEKKVKFDKNYDFDDAEALAKAKLTQKMKESDDEELF